MLIPQLRAGCLVLLSCVVLLAHADIYKWRDDDNLVNFTQQPPEDRPYEQIHVILPAPIAAQQPSTETEQLIEELEELDAQREAEEQLQQQQAAIDAFRQESCEIAQENLQTYQNNPGRRFINEAGEVTRPTEEERQQKMDEFRQDIEQFC